MQMSSLSDSVQPLRVDGYEILDELGHGGMAVVYRARHLALKRIVALKMVKSGSPLAAGSRDRLRLEARTLALLTHPNIVQVFDVGEQDGVPYFSLELVEGMNLAQWMDGHPRPPRVAARILEKIARAVEYAHANGVLHRDLKPGNILVTTGQAPISTDPETVPEVKVTDFGLSKVFDHGSGFVEPLTQAGTLLGTPSYMAPEQARAGEQAITHHADIYALGAILYELLSGRPPFLASTPLQTLLQVVHDDPVPISRLQPQVPRDLATICGKCLLKEPGRRYARAADLADDLARFINHEPVRARPIGPISRIAHWTTRRPAQAGLLAMLIAVFLVGVALVLWQWQEATFARRQAETLAASESQSRQQAERVANELLLEQSLDLCEQGEVGAGMLGLANSLRQAVRCGHVDLEHVIRANLACWSSRLLVSAQSPPFGASTTSISFSPDGKRLLVGRWANQFQIRGPGEAQIWDVSAWKPSEISLVHDGPVTAVAFSPDGARALTASNDGSVRIWDAATGQPLGPINRDLLRASAVAFSPDGKYYAAGGLSRSSGNRGEVRIWKTNSGLSDCVPIAHPGQVFALSFSPESSVLMTGCADESGTPNSKTPARGQACLFEVTTGTPIDTPIHLAAPVRVVGFSVNGKRLLTGSDDQAIRLWERSNGRLIGSPYTQPFPIQAAAFTPDGKSLVVGGGNPRRNGGEGSVLIWDTYSGKQLPGSFSHPDIVHGLAVSQDGRTLATACRDGRIRLWELGNTRPDVEQIVSFPISNVNCSLNNRWALAFGFDPATGMGCSFLWDLANHRSSGAIFNHPRMIEASTFTPNGESFALAFSDRHISVYNTDANPVEIKRYSLPEMIESIAYSADATLLMVSMKGGLVRILEAGTGEIVRDFSCPAPSVHLGVFSDDGRTLLLGGPDGIARTWNWTVRRDRAVVVADSKSIHALAIDPTGEEFLVGTAQGVARRFHAGTGVPHGMPIQHEEDIVWKVFFAKPGHGIVTIAGSPYCDWGIVRFWDGDTGRLRAPASPFRVHIKATAVHYGLSLLATAGWEGDIRLWDLRTGRAVGPRLRYPNTASTVAFSSDGKSLAVGSETNRIFSVWSIPKPVEGTPDEIDQWVRTHTDGKRNKPKK
ncbi:hypothetical protein BH11PLA2_BH11PLA2_37520 [soil metagenome]